MARRAACVQHSSFSCADWKCSQSDVPTSYWHSAPDRPSTVIDQWPGLASPLKTTAFPQPSRDHSMLEAINVCMRFADNRALDGVSLKVASGDIYCLLGANGAGKTTLVNLFLNFLAPTSGEVIINGLNVTKHPLETKQFLAYIPEQVTLYGVLSGLENLAFFSSLALGGRLPPERLQGLLDAAGLPPEAANRKVATYSKGVRQKVGTGVAYFSDGRPLYKSPRHSRGLMTGQAKPIRSA
jgi:ABC-type transport system involved in cytochrome c biogenesis ATPase subunit